MLVKNVVYEDSILLVLQEAGENPGLVAAYRDEAPVAGERNGVVSKRDHEHAAWHERGGNSFNENPDGGRIGQMGDRVAHAEDCRRHFCNMVWKRKQVIVDHGNRQIASEVVENAA